MYGSDKAVGMSILVIILTGYFGAKLAKSQGLKIFTELQTKLQSGQVPNLELVEGLLVMFGGLMLLTPGYMTDTLGLMLLFPLTRKLFASSLQKKNLKIRQKRHSMPTSQALLEEDLELRGRARALMTAKNTMSQSKPKKLMTS